MYSLDPVRNGEIYAIIDSVVVEEMLHLTLSSNVLNALGGVSQINHPGFIPSYPGPLPGGVESDLKVNLAPFSMQQLQTFLTIEQPEDPLHLPVLAANVALSNTITIGEFYTAIINAIAALGDGAFVNPPHQQVGPDLVEGSVVVTDVASAHHALSIIIQQGEGTTSSPVEGPGGQVAHYYRFQQIEKGQLLEKVPGTNPPQYAFSGATVTFDPQGVYPLPTNPGAPPGYPAHSVQSFANDNFNYTYTSLLLALHDLFSGNNNKAQMGRAVGLMMSLKGQAKAMMTGIPDPKIIAAPSFQYQPVNPKGN
jgi:hypothetical protein